MDPRHRIVVALVLLGVLAAAVWLFAFAPGAIPGD